MKTASIRRRGPSPGTILLVGALFCIGLVVLTVRVALGQPWLGLTLRADFGSGDVTIASARGPAAALPEGARLLAVGEGDGRLAVEATDLIEEPDFFSSYAEMEALFARQTIFHRALSAPSVVLLLDGGGAAQEHRLSPARRPIGSLPAVFWFQIFAGAAAFLLALWVLVLRQRDLAVRLFAFTGLVLPVVTFSAAIYSTRELALDGSLFSALSIMNNTASLLFGGALVGLFLIHPRRLVHPRWLLVLAAVLVPWTVAAGLRVLPGPDEALRLPIILELVAMAVLVLIQWRATRGDPRERAALRWFGVMILVGCGLFAFTVMATRLLGWFPPLSQGYSFGFFLLMDVGLAVGLLRHRLFALDGWAYAILFWVLGALALIAFDALLFLGLNLGAGPSLGLALLICSFLYLPVRSLLWTKLVSRRSLDEHQLFQGVIDVAFGSTPQARRMQWEELLRRVFEPLEIREQKETQTTNDVEILNDGLQLALPAVASMPALHLEYPWQGRSLFAPRHAKLAASLVDLVGRAERSRDAYDRGVREERVRIARDLHDDVGSRLLTSLHRENLEETRGTIREAIQEIRSVITQMTVESLPLEQVLADLRHEITARLEAVGTQVDWPPPTGESPTLRVDQPLYRAFTSMVREVISNVIRHAGATRVQVEVRWDAGWMRTTVRDDGIGIDEPTESAGHGLQNLRRRAAGLGGMVEIRSASPGTEIRISLPIEDAAGGSEPGARLRPDPLLAGRAPDVLSSADSRSEPLNEAIPGGSHGSIR